MIVTEFVVLAASQLVGLALREHADTVLIKCLKDMSDEMHKAYAEWEESKFGTVHKELFGAFMDGAFGASAPEEDADDPQTMVAFKAGRIWRLAKEGEVAAALGTRAVVICKEMGYDVTE